MQTIEFSELISKANQRPLDDTDQRILDATLSEMAVHGVDRLSLEQVAKRARINRATIYRRFGNREKLESALAVREGRRLAMTLLEATAGIEDPHERFKEGFVAAVMFARNHTLLSHTAEHDPAILLAAGLAEDGALLRVGAEFMAAAVRWAQERGAAQHLDANAAGDVAARLFASFVLIPVGDFALVDEVEVRKYAEGTFVPLMLGDSSVHF